MLVLINNKTKFVQTVAKDWDDALEKWQNLRKEGILCTISHASSKRSKRS